MAEPNAKSIFVAPTPPKKSLNVLPNPAPTVAPKNPVCNFFGNFLSIDMPNNAPVNITALSMIPKIIYSTIFFPRFLSGIIYDLIPIVKNYLLYNSHHYIVARLLVFFRQVNHLRSNADVHWLANHNPYTKLGHIKLF